MVGLQPLSAVFFLLLVPHTAMAATTATTTPSSPSPSKLLHDKCEIYAAGDRASYDYCVRTLRSDSATATTNDERRLAVIAIRIARATALATRDKIARLRRGAETAEPARRDGLAACAAEYATTVRRLGGVARSVASYRGVSKRDLRMAEAMLGWVTGAPQRCIVACQRAGGKGWSPLDDADLQLNSIVGVAIDFLPMRSTPPSPGA
uniref:Pectinesterase inhibitor domain-containing protein n=1 Tax=Leersia perrieri TaxID=77586 RepID=A0A0D9WX71_9ORYZ